jgi:hypothetical protein
VRGLADVVATNELKRVISIPALDKAGETTNYGASVVEDHGKGSLLVVERGGGHTHPSVQVLTALILAEVYPGNHQIWWQFFVTLQQAA